MGPQISRESDSDSETNYALLNLGEALETYIAQSRLVLFFKKAHMTHELHGEGGVKRVPNYPIPFRGPWWSWALVVRPLP